MAKRDLTLDSNLSDTDLQAVKSGEDVSSLELSTFGNKTKTNGDLDVHGNITTLDHNSRVKTWKIESEDELRLVTNRSDAGAVYSNDQVVFTTGGNYVQMAFDIGSTRNCFINAFSQNGAMDIQNNSTTDDVGEGHIQISSHNTANAARAMIFIDSEGPMELQSGTTMTLDCNGGHLTLEATDNIVLDPDDDLVVSGADIKLDATKAIYLDGGGDTYIVEAGPDAIRIIVGGDQMLNMSESGASGNLAHFRTACVGFDQLEPTYDATNTVVEFRHSNKQNLTFGAGNITNLKLYFPAASGNFVLLIKQDGTGSRTIASYKVYEFDGTVASGGGGVVKFAGGSNPTLTTDANHVDILSFYWDADNQIAYGVPTLDFQF